MSALQDKLHNYIVDNYLFGGNRPLADTDSFLDLGIIDSTGILEVVSYIEGEFGITIESEEIIPENFDSVEKLTKFVTTKAPQGQTDCSQSPSGVRS